MVVVEDSTIHDIMFLIQCLIFCFCSMRKPFFSDGKVIFLHASAVSLLSVVYLHVKYLRSHVIIDKFHLRFVLQTVVESGIADQMRITELILHDVSFVRLFASC